MNSAQLKYRTTQGGQKIGDLMTAVAKVAPPFDILNALGLRVTADVTVPNSTSVDRILTVNFGPSATATATAELPGPAVDEDDTGYPVIGLTLTGAGDGYVAPPIVQIADPSGLGAKGRALLTMNSCNLLTGGGGYSNDTICVVYGGLPPGSVNDTPIQYQKVIRVAMTAGGSGYSKQTTVTFLGGFVPGGKAAIGAPIIQAGVLVGIVLSADALHPLGGDSYVFAPKIVIVDPTGAGSGAAAVAQMADGRKSFVRGTPALINVTITATMVAGLNIIRPGSGYVSPPRLLFLDPTNVPASLAVGSVSMGVGSVELLASGSGYTDPTVALVPRFQSLFPPTCDQRAPLGNLMTPSLCKALATPVVASLPVLS